MKISSNVRRIAAVVLIAVIAALMTGCGVKKTENSGGDEAKENNGAAAKAQAAPKGRYMETAVPLPLEDGDEVLDMIRTQDGALELYIRKTEGKSAVDKAYRYDGTDWKKEETFTAQSIPKGCSPLYSAYGKDGTLYVIYTDSKYKAHLGKFTVNSPMKELSVGIEDDTPAVNGLYVEDDSTVIIPVGDHVLIVDSSGAVKDKIPQKDSSSNFCDSHTLTAHSFLTVGDQGFLRYNSEDWSEEESIPFQNDDTDMFGSLDAGSGDDFYLANSKGIHHMAAQGTMWETVAAGSLNSMGMPSVSVKRLFVGKDNDFYLWYVDNDVSKLAHYTYDPDMPSVPSKTITVYGLDLSGNRSIKQAASLFQMDNPDIRIDLIEGAGAGSTSKTDTIRSLNAELLNGSGADVLVLDGLPSDSYAEKGILDHLNDLITPMGESGELYSNIVKNFTASDGSIYEYPVRILLPVIYGDETAIDGTGSLETLKNWQEKNPDKPIFPKTIYENILRQLIYLYYPELKSSTAGRPDKGKIQLLLETAKTVGDAGGCKVEFDKSEDGGQGSRYNEVQDGGFCLGGNDNNIMEGSAAGSIEQIKGMEDVMIPYAIAEKYGYRLRQFQDIYYPNGLLGVVKSSKEKDAARKFVEFAVSPAIQENDLKDGFPVNKKAAGAWLKRTSSISLGLSCKTGKNTVEISAEYPDDQKKNKVMDMLDGLNTPVAVDDIILEMLVAETKGYFDGTQTAAEAASQFENKAKLYYSE